MMFDGSAPNDRSEMRLNVHYRGMDVERGRMSALELGPAIFGVGQMVGRTSRVLYGDEARVNVEVRANFERASFGIEFFAVSPGAELVPSLTLEQLANICIILGFAGGTVAGGMKGLLWIARKLEGKDIDSVEVKGDETTIHAEGESFDITFNEYQVLSDPGVREGLEGLVSPLKKEGVSEVQMQAGDQEPVEIEREEREYFDLPPMPEEEVSVETSRRVVEVVAPVFREENKWRFAEGDVTYFAEIVDEEFLDRVAKREIEFGQGDALLVELETRTSQVEDQLEYERKIVRVLKHLKPSEGEQIDLLTDSGRGRGGEAEENG